MHIQSITGSPATMAYRAGPTLNYGQHRIWCIISCTSLHEKMDWTGLIMPASPLDRFPRAKLLQQPTPTERLDRLSDHLGIDLWIKRDDLAGVSFGGNKSRQLEYYLGAAVACESTVILITGAVQSNFVRTAAASAAKLGMRTVIQLEDRVASPEVAYEHSGNVFLSQILGAEIMRYPEGENEAGADKALRERAAELETEGERPFVIPLGLGNKPLGAMGYMRAAEEIVQFGMQFNRIFVASGSGLTHAGLLCGLRLLGDQTAVTGSCVRRPADAQHARIATVIADLQKLLEQNSGVSEQDINIWDGALAPGYGQVGPKAAEAIRMVARMEGLFLDPVYTSKVFAAIPAQIENGDLRKGSRVLFVHTGGLPALFAYEESILAALDSANG
jgi:D-cysteine desulfhydrase family pyridoxal phosphate-dependent enzyme